jgi:hypothetical protein
MSARCRSKLSLIRLAVVLFAGWASQAACSGESANTNGLPSKYEEPKLWLGTIYANDSGRQYALFKFKRVVARSGSQVNVLREYTYPDGKLAARERFVYEGNDLVSYALDELQIGTAGSVKVQRDAANPGKSTLRFEYTKDLASASKAKTSTETFCALTP